MREQLDFFFDQRTKSGGVGLPANFPMLVKGNPAPWWSYRAYDAFPVAVYQDGERIEDNLAQWEQLIDRIELRPKYIKQFQSRLLCYSSYTN